MSTIAIAFHREERRPNWHAAQEPAPLTRSLLPGSLQRFCPHCHSVVYSRRSRWCGACERALPDHLLFSESDAVRVRETLDAERAKHRAWMRRNQSINVPHIIGALFE